MGLLAERNGEGERTRAFVLVINISWSSVATFTWSPYARKNSSNSSTAFPKGCSQRYSSLGPAAVAGWDILWKALVLLCRGSRTFMLINSTGSWTSKDALWVTHLCFGSGADSTGGQEGTSPFLLSSAAKVTWVAAVGGGELYPAPAEALAAAHSQRGTGHQGPKV